MVWDSNDDWIDDNTSGGQDEKWQRDSNDHGSRTNDNSRRPSHKTPKSPDAHWKQQQKHQHQTRAKSSDWSAQAQADWNHQQQQWKQQQRQRGAAPSNQRPARSLSVRRRAQSPSRRPQRVSARPRSASPRQGRNANQKAQYQYCTDLTCDGYEFARNGKTKCRKCSKPLTEPPEDYLRASQQSHDAAAAASAPQAAVTPGDITSSLSTQQLQTITNICPAFQTALETALAPAPPPPPPEVSPEQFLHDAQTANQKAIKEVKEAQVQEAEFSVFLSDLHQKFVNAHKEFNDKVEVTEQARKKQVITAAAAAAAHAQSVQALPTVAHDSVAESLLKATLPTNLDPQAQADLDKALASVNRIIQQNAEQKKQQQLIAVQQQELEDQQAVQAETLRRQNIEEQVSAHYAAVQQASTHIEQAANLHSTTAQLAHSSPQAAALLATAATAHAAATSSTAAAQHAAAQEQIQPTQLPPWRLYSHICSNTILTTLPDPAKNRKLTMDFITMVQNFPKDDQRWKTIAGEPKFMQPAQLLLAEVLRIYTALPDDTKLRDTRRDPQYPCLLATNGNRMASTRRFSITKKLEHLDQVTIGETLHYPVAVAKTYLNRYQQGTLSPTHMAALGLDQARVV